MQYVVKEHIQKLEVLLAWVKDQEVPVLVLEDELILGLLLLPPELDDPEHFLAVQLAISDLQGLPLPHIVLWARFEVHVKKRETFPLEAVPRMIFVDPEPRYCRRLRELNDRLPLVIEYVRLSHSYCIVPGVLFYHVV